MVDKRIDNARKLFAKFERTNSLPDLKEAINVIDDEISDCDENDRKIAKNIFTVNLNKYSSNANEMLENYEKINLIKLQILWNILNEFESSDSLNMDEKSEIKEIKKRLIAAEFFNVVEQRDDEKDIEKDSQHAKAFESFVDEVRKSLNKND